MKRGILLTIIAVLLCYMAVDAQNYDRYNYFHEEAVRLKNEGKLNEARDKFKRIKEICKGGIPIDNDLDRMIRECTTLSVSENGLQFDAAGGQTKNVTVRTNADYFRVSSGSAWCKVMKKGDVVSVSCETNIQPDVRKANVVVAADGRTVSINVSQLGGRLEFEANPDTVSFTKYGETKGVAIYTNASSWLVEPAPNWIECRKNDTMLFIKSSPNPLAEAREATLIVNVFEEKFPIVVHQAESDTMFSFSKEELVLPCSDSEDFLKVESNCGQWEVSTPDNWIDVSANQDIVMVHVLPNESPFSRRGTISIGAGHRLFEVPVYQYAFMSKKPVLKPEIDDEGSANQGMIAVTSIPDNLKVTIVNDLGESSVRYTPFDMPVDYSHYSLKMGLERRELFTNEQQRNVQFKPGLRFATITWAPKASVGMMTGFVGSKSWGAYAHFNANTPIVKAFDSIGSGLSGYNLTIGPVFRPNKFPYVGAYAGIGMGAYSGLPHYGLDYEAGVMGFYKNLMLTMGFHTSRLNAEVQHTSFALGLGGYLKRYYDSSLGYCASDSRRWFSLNYVSRPAVNGKGVMIGDLGKEKLRAYLKAMYLPDTQASDSLDIKNIEGGAGILITPVNGLIDVTLGVSATANLSGLEERFQGMGVELGAILNVWRFPITVMLHESDLLGDRHLYVDFGIGFHLGEFKKSKCSYQ